MTEEKNYIIVELRSNTLAAFDLPDEKGVRYKIPNFQPGLYQIPLKAIKKATTEEQEKESENIIYVDTGTIFFVDANYYSKLREIENRIWEETKDSYNFFERYDSVVKELGIKFNYIISPGVNSGYDFEGDGDYVLDMSLIQKVSK